ncbi:MAG: hypothetical protein F6K56_22990 [Moorea sp. SIO3G5]|nr:hypothetical protein [Moorena sp. SIO3G5]
MVIPIHLFPCSILVSIQRSAVSGQWSVVSRQPSAVSRLPLAVPVAWA